MPWKFLRAVFAPETGDGGGASAADSSGPIGLDDAVGLLTGFDDDNDDAPPAAEDGARDGTSLPEGEEPDGEAAAEETPPSGEEEDADQPEPDADAAKSTGAPAIEPPASWPKEEAERFKQLPPETQAYLAKRESERDTFVSQKANEYALATQRTQAQEQQYGALLAHAAESLQALTADEFAGIDWDRLAREHPGDYVAMQHRWNLRQQQLAAVQQERERVVQIQQARTQQAVKSYVADQRAKLLAAIPEFRDPAKAKAESARIKDFLTSAGFSAQEVGGLTDHRHVLLVRKAMAYDAAQKAKAEKTAKAVPPVKPVQKPGVPAGKAGQAKSQRDALFTKLERTGDLSIAAALLRT